MICKKCHQEIENDSVFCVHCGANQNEVEEVIEIKEQEEETIEVESQDQPEVSNVFPEEDKSNFSSAIYTNEFEYTKKIFNRYYRTEFVCRSLAGYIILQIFLLNMLILPGILFALIYWFITNPVTKASQWRHIVFENKGNQPLYRFFFEENTLVVRRNRVEECTMQYKDFKKIVFNKKGLIFLSKTQDFYIPVEEIKNKEEIIEILSKADNVKFKCKH